MVLGLVSVSCGSPFQVIEELEFDPSLGVALDSMTRLESGVYVQDDSVGTGAEVVVGAQVLIDHVGYLADGSSFGSGEYGFELGAVGDEGVVRGLDIGMTGMREGGARRIIVPPELGYGDRDATLIPSGSVLIFDVTVLEVTPPAAGA